ncbi:RNA polymerase subunit sigma [Myxococcus qinghaiensis]|uniref:RNA polymerase subunit sigma n=1 Tax=Myxococcus qinghaiensis TaxID=2906758 RepID=UPI0020A73272|nr:RNA polymerase subunit sigma [Myxococcus qinghaiensis]MCP3169674.1 RNA polymerase subunit sigma [Myxococcus qinghaiensis]
MADTVDPKYLDKRTAERYLRSGQLDEKAFERHVKGLPDVADKATPVETFMDDDVTDDYDDEEDDLDEEEDEADEEDEEDEDESSDVADESPVSTDEAALKDIAEGGEEPNTP